MAIQKFTTARIDGVAGRRVLKRVQRWALARDAAAPSNEFAPEHWPDWVHSEVDAFVNSLRRHAVEYPVLYFNEHVDMWSMGDVPFRLISLPGGRLPTEVASRQFEIYCIAPRASGEFELSLKRFLRRRRITEESRWLARRLLEAVATWEIIPDTTAIILVRDVYGVLIGTELAASLDSVPHWLSSIAERPRSPVDQIRSEARE